MTIPSDYALLATSAYDDTRPRPLNHAPIPSGWEELKQYAVAGSGPNAVSDGAGFSVKVFKHTSGEIVISYAGTQFGGLGDGKRYDWTAGNLPAALGLPTAQARLAAQKYLEVRKAEGDNITFTGHSLGGGLAALMGVYFNKTANVFAPAQFSLAATRRAFDSTIRDVKSSLEAAIATNPAKYGGIPQAFLDYAPARFDFTAPSQYDARKANVHSWAVKGEVLEFGTPEALFIENFVNRTHLLDAGLPELGPLGFLTKHSIDLHAAALLSPTFNEWGAKLTTALSVVFNKDLYAADLLGDGAQDFLVKLLRNEVATDTLPTPSKMLTHNANDLAKLGTDMAGLNKQAQSALIAQSTEWYYRQGAGYGGQEFYSQAAGALQYTIDIPGIGNPHKADLYVRPWLNAIFNADSYGQLAAYGATTVVSFSEWNVATSGSRSTASAVSVDKTQIFIGNAGSDVFTGGSKADTFLTGGGNDELDGGGGNDILRGGAGDDKYKFSGNFGKDEIIDSDGQGAILWDGNTLGTARAAGRADTWVINLGGNKFVGLRVYDDKASTTGKKLVIADQDGVNTVTVNNFNLTDALGTGYLGIKLRPEQSVALIEGDAAKVGATPRWMNNVWSDSEFTESKLVGFSSNIAERTGASFIVNLARAAEAGDTLTISTAGLDGTFKVILGDRTVDANGAVITLGEGDTTASFALISDGEITSDLAGQISVNFQGGGANAQSVTSNAWGVNVEDGGEVDETINGDFNIKLDQFPSDENWYNKREDDATRLLIVNAGETGYAVELNQGSTTGPKATALQRDLQGPLWVDNVLYGDGGANGVAKNDRINGLTGDDVLTGFKGNDTIDGGEGNDLIGGGSGSDNIKGGDGDDVIFSSQNVQFLSGGTGRSYSDTRSLLPTYYVPIGVNDTWDRWGVPADGTLIRAYKTWGTYTLTPGQEDSVTYYPVIPDSGALREDRSGDYVDAGAGDDVVFASWGADRVLDGAGRLLAANDSLFCVTKLFRRCAL
jgi:RTX calcium-binding nonapeptide repeat (4 copies)/Lipase (class 3)